MHYNFFFALYMFKTYERCDFASELLKMQADKNTGEVSIYTIISNNQMNSNNEKKILVTLHLFINVNEH